MEKKKDLVGETEKRGAEKKKARSKATLRQKKKMAPTGEKKGLGRECQEKAPINRRFALNSQKAIRKRKKFRNVLNERHKKTKLVLPGATSGGVGK